METPNLKKGISMTLLTYSGVLLSNFYDKRIIQNTKQMIQNIVENKSIRIWSNSKDKAEFDRHKSLLDGSLKSILDDKKISDALHKNGVNVLADSDHLILLHDPCDIRKEHSKGLENLGKVRSLDGDIINGYSTFNTVAVDEKNKQVRLIDLAVYSNGDPHYVTQEELKQYQKGGLQKSQNPQDRHRAEQISRFMEDDTYVNLSRLTHKQLQLSSELFKKDNPHLIITHVLDRQFDGNEYFSFIDKELQDEFVIRLKSSRNSNQSVIDEETHKKHLIKLKDVSLTHSDSLFMDKLLIKSKVYQQVKCLLEWDIYSIEGKDYTAVRISLIDRKGLPIFKEPMLLITNRTVSNAEQARCVYHLYLKRFKIEGVFKFLKNVLGWEDFQVRDFESIKNIIALCFFVGGYFYEIESALTQNHTIQYLCALGDGKGKVTRHYFLKGIAKLLIHKSVEQFVEQQSISPDQFREMMAFVTLNATDH
jgi:hypothetical protein